MRLHRDKVEGSKKGFGDTYRVGRKVISEQEESEDDSFRSTRKKRVVSGSKMTKGEEI